MTFLASRDLPQMKSIAIEHLELCQACNQRAASHAMGNENTSTNEELLSAAKFASDATQLNRDLLQQINDTFEQLAIIIHKAQVAAKDLEKMKQERALLTQAKRTVTMTQKLITAALTIIGVITTIIVT